MGRNVQSLILLGLVINSLWLVDATSPVVLWTLKRIGEGNLESNLNEFSPQQFADLVAWKTEQGTFPVIAFGLDSLSLEDLASQGGIGATEPYRKLRKITDASAETLLFPAVQSAGESISILQQKGFQVVQINAGDVLPKLETPNTILIINEKSNVNMDDEVLRVFSKYTLDFPNLVGMLWGKRSTWTEEPEDEANEILSRKKRQAPPPESNATFVYNDQNGLFMVFRDVALTVYPDKNTAIYKTATASTQDANGTTILNLVFAPRTEGLKISKFELKLTLQKGIMGYWSMKNATAALSGTTNTSKAFNFNDEWLTSAITLVVPTHLSFHCSRFGSLRPIDRKENSTFTIDFRGFQIQAFMPASTQNKFADAYECVGFFTPGIWMGIIVTIMLLSILSWGMYMIMDVKTMDRFDDPKGKPISFGGND
ncbi:V-type proton ATPase subunit S1 [Orchesella cincta]|uniref:V-type proton ATPase subunit S1 n=1 Tax=Orchesella cincta TaxID=48709 RepID=A0A1D2MY34_ORCCI|nr:V-type proton ATPase subunit S1 [Orchesella cincta]